MMQWWHGALPFGAGDEAARGVSEGIGIVNTHEAEILGQTIDRTVLRRASWECP